MYAASFGKCLNRKVFNIAIHPGKKNYLMKIYNVNS